MSRVKSPIRIFSYLSVDLSGCVSVAFRHVAVVASETDDAKIEAKNDQFDHCLQLTHL